MTSHFRHRRDGNAAAAFATPLEKGEIAVNTANRQIAVGDVVDGQPLALIAVRYFDARSQYATNDFVVYQDSLYVALESISPGAFNAIQWRMASHEASDPTDLANYLLKAGDTMTGTLVLAGDPVEDLDAATKAYVDSSQPPPPDAADIPITPVGGISATDLQSAIAELDAEKVNRSGDTMTGHLVLPPAPAATNAVRKDYVDSGDTALATSITGLDNKKVNRGGDTMVGNLRVEADLYVSRSAASGVVFLGSNGSHYLFFDGSVYRMPSGGLVVGGDLGAVGGNFGGMLNANGGINLPAGPIHTINTSNATFASAAPSNVQIYGSNAYPTVSFHAPGYFAANFGMNVDGNFYMGGWSHGEGVAYKFWTTRDFAPSNVASGGRLAFAAGWVQGPYQGSNQRPVHSVIHDVTLGSQGDYFMVVAASYIQLQTIDGNFVTLNQAF